MGWKWGENKDRTRIATLPCICSSVFRTEIRTLRISTAYLLSVVRGIIMLLGSIISIIVVSIGLLLAKDIVGNNIRLAQYEKEFMYIRHPQDTSVVKTVRRVGRLIGDRDHCDFFVGQARRYFSGSRQEIEEYYTRQVTKGGALPVETVFIENGIFVGSDEWVLPDKLSEPAQWSVQSADIPSDIYVVYFFSILHDPGLDPRCNS